MVFSLTILIAFSVSWLAAAGMESLSGPVRIVGSFVRLVLTHNPYIAFSIALPPAIQTTLIGGALVAVCFVALKAKDRVSRIAFGFIIGGALANIVDRLADGFVTDYLSIGTFPVFNVADIFISLGAGLLILEGVHGGKRN